MKIGSRLEGIIEFVPHNSIVADIGTDHGYIPAYLIKYNISKKVIGTDISKPSLDKIKNYINDLGYTHSIDARLGDGLETIKPFEVDTVIIAGMGGILITEILEKQKEIRDSITNFIFQPMIASDELRKYLVDNSFIIVDEKLVKEDNKYYEIIYAIKGKSYIEKDIHYEIGYQLIERRDPLLKEFIHMKIKIQEKIIKDLEGKETEKSQDRLKELNNKINQYREVLKELEG